MIVLRGIVPRQSLSAVGSLTQASLFVEVSFSVSPSVFVVGCLSFLHGIRKRAAGPGSCRFLQRFGPARPKHHFGCLCSNEHCGLGVFGVIPLHCGSYAHLRGTNCPAYAEQACLLCQYSIVLYWTRKTGNVTFSLNCFEKLSDVSDSA